jgi:hypothetical protein
VYDGVRMVWTSHLEKFLKVIGGLMCLALEIMLHGHDVLLVGAIRLPVVVVIAVGSNSDPLGALLLPRLRPLTHALAPLPVALGGTPRLPLGTVFPLPWMKTAPTTSSPKACRVVMSSSSFVVFG